MPETKSRDVSHESACPRVLLCASTSQFVNDHLQHFIRLFQQNGWIVDVACRIDQPIECADNQYHVPFSQSPYRAHNLVAYRRLTAILEENRYDLIQCQQPISAAVVRLAARSARQSGVKILYALFCGFPFQKGSSSMDWQIYYPIEKRMAQHTDLIVACTQEDYALAKNRRFTTTECMYVHGSGIDVERFRPVTLMEKMQVRKKLGIHPQEIVLLCNDDWEESSNQKMLIHGLSMAEERDHRLRLYLLGEGPRMNKLKEFAKAKKIEHWIRFPGQCDNMEEWLQASDVVLSASESVEQPTGLLEAMACGIPIVASKIRGHSDIIVNDRSGVLFKLDDVSALARGIFTALAHQQEIGEGAREMAMLFSKENVLREMALAYEHLTGQTFSQGIKPKSATEPDFISVQYAVR